MISFLSKYVPCHFKQNIKEKSWSFCAHAAFLNQQPHPRFSVSTGHITFHLADKARNLGVILGSFLSLLVNHKVPFVQPPNYSSGMTLPLHPFCHRSSSGPHLLLPPIYNSVFIGLLGSILIHFKFFLSTVAYQSALEHRCGHITFLSLAPH